jgi:hypothetical protein
MVNGMAPPSASGRGRVRIDHALGEQAQPLVRALLLLQDGQQRLQILVQPELLGPGGKEPYTAIS